MSYFQQYSRKKTRPLTVLLTTFFVLLLIVFLILRSLNNQYYQQVHTPIDLSDTNQILFQIEKNENIKTTTFRLKEKGLIQSDIFFWWYLRNNNLIPSIQAGTHYLSKSYDYAQIAKELGKARPLEINLTIPEGYTIAQIDSKLAEESLIEAGDFINATENYNISDYTFLTNQNLEGYLFPDTYRIFADNFDSKSLIKKMLNNFQQKIETIYDAESNKYSLSQIVIMASILEKETNHKDNRAVVAGILWKRLEEGMLLGADATTRYALNKITEPLTYDDLASDSPYNTRKNKGLPPGAIANPGLASLKAAINPEESPYYYYLHDSNGEIHYGESNEEHNLNKNKYL